MNEPYWFCPKCGEIFLAEYITQSGPVKCPKLSCGSQKVIRADADMANVFMAMYANRFTIINGNMRCTLDSISPQIIFKLAPYDNNVSNLVKITVSTLNSVISYSGFEFTDSDDKLYLSFTMENGKFINTQLSQLEPLEKMKAIYEVKQVFIDILRNNMFMSQLAKIIVLID